MAAYDYDLAYKHTSWHRAEIRASEACGCFFCFETFGPDEITTWLAETDAVCPQCGIDSVIGSRSGFPIDEEFLLGMHEHWFVETRAEAVKRWPSIAGFAEGKGEPIINECWEQLTDDDWDAFAAAWLNEIRNATSPSGGAVSQQVLDMSFTAAPDLQWKFIRCALAQATSDEELSLIAAGPTEHLLSWHGEFIQEAEAEAARNKKFARMLTGVWKCGMSDEVWARLQAIQRTVPDPMN